MPTEPDLPLKHSDFPERGQIPLAFELPEVLDRAHFHTGACNELALGWLERWPDWPGPTLFISGPSGAGKTHLVRIWLEISKGHLIDAKDIYAPASLEHLQKGKALALDDTEALYGDPEAETALFHLYNAAKNNGGWLVLSGRTAPAHIDFRLADLASRLRAAPLAALQPPDDTLLGMLLRKQLADRGLEISDKVLSYTLPRIERSFAAIRNLAETIDRLTLAEKRPVTIPLISSILENV